ncbi:ankyrin repeat-containing domain protein [Bombardia bombarda]|uniref:Ankyrin repeat-containing domain protein n=1 Tax=Bombardia bombarda TaxID=252184 RepID=A0AA39WM96_9PEZI|nr:ankyrin repeat-containing domain protein [Bombardia bombarda]
MLLERGANLDAQDEYGVTPLSISLTYGFFEIAKTLIDAGADPNKSKRFRNSPLHCVFGNLWEPNEKLTEMVKSLVDKGADLLREGENGETALHFAVKHGKREIVDYIIDTLNSKGPVEKISDLYSAALCECVSATEFNLEMAEIAERLVAQGLDINKATKFGLIALQAACANGTVEAVKWLLNQKNIDINAKGSRFGTALCAAIGSKESIEDKVLVLLKHETEVDTNLNSEEQPTPLQKAASKGNESLVKLLLKHKADVNLTKPGCDTPLNEAILQHKITMETIKMLLTGGADIHRRGVAGKLPVHAAAISDRSDVMEILCSAQADARAKDDNGLSPLMHAVLNNSVSVFKFLLSQHAYDLDEADSKGQTPLIVASILGDKSILNELLNSEFKVQDILNAQDFHGKTALAYAVRMDLLEVVKTLVGNGADASIADYRGYSPLYWAVRMASQETTEVIMEAMEKRPERNTTEHRSIVIHGAIASNKRQVLEQLIDHSDVDTDLSTPEGWTPLYTALMYGSSRMTEILREKLGTRYPGNPDYRRRPSRWHPRDKHPGIKIDPKNLAAFVTDGTNRYLNLIEFNKSMMTRMGQYGMVRANFPMLPLFNDRVYYFEVTLNAVGTPGGGFMAVGFSDDQASLNKMLGLDSGGWGFHSDDGRVFEDGRKYDGNEYDSPYGEVNVTIGCGVNFAKNTAFYTKNGNVIAGWRVATVFPGEHGTSDGFVFKGDFEGENTLAPSELAQRNSDDTGKTDKSDD